MRTFFILGTMALAFAATGCGGNQSNAEHALQQMVDQMNVIADNFEKGDKAAIKANFAKLAEIVKSNKDIPLDESQKKAAEAKYKPQLEAAQKRMIKAMTTSKMSPADLMELTKDMQEFGKGVQNMAK